MRAVRSSILLKVENSYFEILSFERRTPTVFGRVCGFGCWRDLAGRRSVVTDLMQEVDGLSDEQHLRGRGRRRSQQQQQQRGVWRERFLTVSYLAGLVHGDEGGDHGLPEGVLVVPQTVRLHVGVWSYEELRKNNSTSLDLSQRPDVFLMFRKDLKKNKNWRTWSKKTSTDIQQESEPDVQS